MKMDRKRISREMAEGRGEEGVASASSSGGKRKADPGFFTFVFKFPTFSPVYRYCVRFR